MNHLTSIQLQEYSDRLCPSAEFSEIELHLRTCEECAAKVQAFARFEMAIRNIPLEQVSPQFTQRVMERLKITKSRPFGWLIFKNLAPLIGLFFIAGVVYSVLKLTGVNDNTGIENSVNATRSVYYNVGNSLSNGITALNGWMKNLFPFLYTKSQYGLAVFLLGFFGVIALLDKFLFIPMFKRKI